MNVLVSEKLWFTKDGSWYRHPRFSKFKFDWQKVKALAEGEAVLESESDSEGAPEQESTRRQGKEAVIPKKKRSYTPRSGGKLEIKEGRRTPLDDSESESDSEGDRPQGEPSNSNMEAVLIKFIEEKVQKMQKELTNSILDAIRNFQGNKQGTSSPFGFTSDPKPSTPIKSASEGTDHTMEIPTDQPSDVPCAPPSETPKNQSPQAQMTEPPVVILSDATEELDDAKSTGTEDIQEKTRSDHGPKSMDITQEDLEDTRVSQVPKEHVEKEQSAANVALPTSDLTPPRSETIAAQMLTSLQQNPNQSSSSKPKYVRYKTCARKSVPYVRKKK